MRDSVKIKVDQIGRGEIVVNGQDMSNQVRGVSLRTNVGDLTEIELDLAGVDVTEISAEGEVSVLVGGVKFTREDVNRLMESPPDEPALSDIAKRLSEILPQPPSP